MILWNWNVFVCSYVDVNKSCPIECFIHWLRNAKLLDWPLFTKLVWPVHQMQYCNTSWLIHVLVNLSWAGPELQFLDDLCIWLVHIQLCFHLSGNMRNSATLLWGLPGIWQTLTKLIHWKKNSGCIQYSILTCEDSLLHLLCTSIPWVWHREASFGYLYIHTRSRE